MAKKMKAIAFGTISYHFIMRILVGFMVGYVMNNQADYHRWWY